MILVDVLNHLLLRACAIVDDFMLIVHQLAQSVRKHLRLGRAQLFDAYHSGLGIILAVDHISRKSVEILALVGLVVGTRLFYTVDIRRVGGCVGDGLLDHLLE